MADDAAAAPVVESQPAAVAPQPPEPAPQPVDSLDAPDQYHYLKWWTLALVLVGVWIPAAGIGLGLYSWWVQDDSPHKTLPVFATLVYVVVSTVLSLLLSMVDGKALVAAVAIAVMSAPLASCAGAAPMYGHTFCAHRQPQHCVAGIIPY